MIEIDVDIFLSVAVAVLALVLGFGIRSRSALVRRFCIPAPVIGGLVIACASLALYVTDTAEFVFDTSLREFFMMLFFTSVGMQVDLAFLKKGGRQFAVLVGMVAVLIVLQNIIGVGVAGGMGLDPLLGLCMGSISMIGGFGPAGAFGPELEAMGVEGALALSVAAATFGMVMGSLIGGPTANRLILRNRLEAGTGPDSGYEVPEERQDMTVDGYFYAFILVIAAMGMGTVLAKAITAAGVIFPPYLGAMIAAVAVRNVMDRVPGREVPTTEVGSILNIGLMMFLVSVIMGLKMWQLADLALPMLIILVLQTVLMFVFSYFLFFRSMGGDYDAAVMSGGLCGFGMGAVTNAMANMQAIVAKFSPSPKAFLMIPLAGVMFADLVNTIVLMVFMNVLA